MALKVRPPETASGMGRDVVEPLPGWPMSFAPQQWAAPALVAAEVPPPAVRRAGGGETAGVTVAGGEHAETQTPGDRHRRCARRSRAVAQLAFGVRAPAVRCPGSGEPAGVGAPRGEGAEGQAP